MRGTLFVENGEILSVEEYAGGQYIMRLHAPECASRARPGSFVHLSCDAMLPMRRPLSIMRVVDDSIEILYKTEGHGLRLLAEKRRGDCLSVLGPIGQPFVIDASRPNCLLLGGGVGIPPMVFLADVLRALPDYRPLALLGSEIPFPFAPEPSSHTADWAPPGTDYAMPLLQSWGVPSRLSSFADFPGCYRGYVTQLARLWLQSLDAATLRETQVFACGPTPMLKAVAALAAEFEMPCQVSLEEYMACAVGGCAGCAVEIRTPQGTAMKRVCVDGPVFDANSVVWR